MELHAWPSSWRLPSVDVLSLQIAAYCRFSGAPVKLVPQTSIVPGRLPKLVHGDHVSCSTLKQVIEHLKVQDYNANHNLGSVQIADISAYGKLMQRSLMPAYLYMIWVDTKNYEELYRPWLASQFGWPISWIALRIYEKGAFSTIQDVCGNPSANLLTDGGKLELEALIFAGAREALSSLSRRLGNQEFLFGQLPTSLDAIAFGYLAPIVCIPLPNNQLKDHLTLRCENLVSFVERILRNYFPLTQMGNSSAKSTNDGNQKSSTRHEEEDEWPNQRRDAIISVTFASVTMFSYAFWIGLLKIDHLRKVIAFTTGGLVFASASAPTKLQMTYEEYQDGDYQPNYDPLLNIFEDTEYTETNDDEEKSENENDQTRE